MYEQWVKWEPVQDMSSSYYIDSVSDSIKGFVVTLSDAEDETKKLRVTFEHSVHAYRSTDESFRQKTVFDLNSHYDERFCSEWSCFKVSHSEYIKWLSDQSYGIADSEPLIHFCFLAVDSILDVIAAYEPKIETMK